MLAMPDTLLAQSCPAMTVSPKGKQENGYSLLLKDSHHDSCLPKLLVHAGRCNAGFTQQRHLAQKLAERAAWALQARVAQALCCARFLQSMNSVT
jgi:hypothetical protein